MGTGTAWMCNIYITNYNNFRCIGILPLIQIETQIMITLLLCKETREAWTSYMFHPLRKRIIEDELSNTLFLELTN